VRRSNEKLLPMLHPRRCEWVLGLRSWASEWAFATASLPRQSGVSGCRQSKPSCRCHQYAGLDCRCPLGAALSRCRDARDKTRCGSLIHARTFVDPQASRPRRARDAVGFNTCLALGDGGLRHRRPQRAPAETATGLQAGRLRSGPAAETASRNTPQSARRRLDRGITTAATGSRCRMAAG